MAYDGAKCHRNAAPRRPACGEGNGTLRRKEREQVFAEHGAGGPACRPAAAAACGLHYGYYLCCWPTVPGDFDCFDEEPGESGEVRWLLYAGANWEYSGYLQYVEEYGYVYAYNDHNGTAYRCELDGAELTVAEIGTFTYGGSGTPDDFQDVEPEPTADVSVLAGDWYQDGDVDGASRVEITADGVWTLLDCTGDMDAMMDYGELIPSQEEGSWFARSTMLDDVEYNVTVADENILYWGGEYDCYIRSQG